MFWNAEIYFVTTVTQIGNFSGRFRMLLVGKYKTVSIRNQWFINWYHEYHHLNEHKTVSAHTGLQMHTYNKQSLKTCIQPIFKVFVALSQLPHLPSITSSQISRVYLCVILCFHRLPHCSSCFSFPRSLPIPLSASFCPLLCQHCNFSLHWENRYNGASAPVCLIKG